MSYTQAGRRLRSPSFKAWHSLLCSHMWCCSLSRMALLYSRNRKKEGELWQQGQTRCWFWLEFIFFIVASMEPLWTWTCAGKSVNNTWCSSYCWAGLSQSQGLFCSSLHPTRKEVAKTGSHIARIADTSWPKGYSTPSAIMLSKKLLGRLGRGSLPGDLLDISWLVMRNCFCLDHLSFLGFILISFSLLLFCHY